VTQSGREPPITGIKKTQSYLSYVGVDGIPACVTQSGREPPITGIKNSELSEICGS